MHHHAVGTEFSSFSSSSVQHARYALGCAIFLSSRHIAMNLESETQVGVLFFGVRANRSPSPRL